MATLPAGLNGVKVFPVQPGDKVPALSWGWQTRATDDPAQLAQWNAGMPNLNWGIPAGSNGLFIFDIDPSGFVAWSELQDKVPGLREAIATSYTVKTPRGGFHHYFKGYGPTTASAIAPGIDTRGGYLDERSGKWKSLGYVVAPGSETVAGPKTAKGTYSYVSGVLGDMPAPVLQLVPERKRGGSLLERDVSKDNPRNIQTARDLLNRYVADGRVSIEGSGGDDTCYKVVASILDKGVSPGAALDLLEEIWNPACSPPWADYELEQKIERVLKYSDEAASGAKGFDTNQDAFKAFAGLEVPTEIEAPKRKRFEPMLLREARLEKRQAKWLVPGFLPDVGVGILYGLSGSYKTFIALDWALSLAHGISGQWETPPVKHSVVFLAGESRFALQEERVNAWCEHHKLDPDASDVQFYLVPGVPSFGDKEGWEEIRNWLVENKIKPDLFAIDTLTRMMNGLDENSNNDGKMMLKHCEDIANYFNCFVLSTGHTGKDENRGLRGGQVFVDNSDAVIYAKTTSVGTSLKIKKLKEVDIPKNPYYLEIKKYGSSIMLARTDEKPAEAAKKGKAKISWSDPKEILEMLTVIGGNCSTSLLADAITEKYGIQKGAVILELHKREDIQYLREGTSEHWRIPGSQEFDL